MKYIQEYEGVAELLRVIAHPVRLCIIKGLLENECNVTKMQESLKLPQSTISQHLSVLRSRGIIKGQRKGLEIKYSVVNETVKKVIGIADENIK